VLSTHNWRLFFKHAVIGVGSTIQLRLVVVVLFLHLSLSQLFDMGMAGRFGRLKHWLVFSNKLLIVRFSSRNSFLCQSRLRPLLAPRYKPKDDTFVHQIYESRPKIYRTSCLWAIHSCALNNSLTDEIRWGRSIWTFFKWDKVSEDVRTVLCL
jgi:hypothetical protein